MLRTLDDQVAVRVEKAVTQTNSGIFLPETREERLQVGQVIAVGPEAHDLAVGDRALFGKFAGTEIKIDYEEYVIVRAPEILATLVGGLGQPSSTALNANAASDDD